MKLTRTMEVEVDLPEAPEGWEWVLLDDRTVQVGLVRGDDSVACITGSEAPISLLVYRLGQYAPTPPKFHSQRDAAEYLFAKLDIGPYFFTASGEVDK